MALDVTNRVEQDMCKSRLEVVMVEERDVSISGKRSLNAISAAGPCRKDVLLITSPRNKVLPSAPQKRVIMSLDSSYISRVYSTVF